MQLGDEAGSSQVIALVSYFASCSVSPTSVIRTRCNLSFLIMRLHFHVTSRQDVISLGLLEMLTSEALVRIVERHACIGITQLTANNTRDKTWSRTARRPLFPSV